MLRLSHNHCTYISDVLRVGEVGQVSVVELLTLQVVTVLARPQVTGLDAAGLEKLLVGHAERLTDGLGDHLSLDEETRRGERTDLGPICKINIVPSLFYPLFSYEQMKAN